MQHDSVAGYRITGKLAEGGMGAVYRAQHTLLGRAAAVKVLLPQLSEDREIVNRFFNEARAVTSIRHPGIVEIFDFGYLASGDAYIVMELLEGETLSRRLAAQGAFDEGRALAIARGIASALAAAHGKGIVHRDLKPDNIFLIPDDDAPAGERPKLLDFGIAKLADAGTAVGEATRTRTGSVMGTPTYMSPEQCRGAGEVDHRCDLYALGCVLHEMLTGRPPFLAEGLGELIAAHMLTAPTAPSLLGARVSTFADGVVLRLLAKRPEDRYQSAGELARLLGSPSVTSGSPAAATVALRVATLAPIAPTPTTLGGSAAESLAGGSMAPPARSRAGLFAALGLVMAAALVGVVAMPNHDRAPHGSNEAAPASRPALAVSPDAGAAATLPPDAAAAPELAGLDAAIVIDAAATAVATSPDAGVAIDRRLPPRKPPRRPRAGPTGPVPEPRPEPTTHHNPIEPEL